MRRSIMRRPSTPLRYTQLVDHLATAMIRGYTIGFRTRGATLRAASRAARLAGYKREVREVLNQYSESASKAVSDTYRNARARGVSVKVATNLALRRFASLGHTAPVSNRLKTLYNAAIRAAHEQGLFDATRNDPDIWGYQFIATEERGKQHPTTRDSHWQYHKVTLPKDHPFWTRVWTPLDWGCRCRIKTFRRPQKIQRPPPNPIPIEAGFQGQDFTLQ